MVPTYWCPNTITQTPCQPLKSRFIFCASMGALSCQVNSIALAMKGTFPRMLHIFFESETGSSYTKPHRIGNSCPSVGHMGHSLSAIRMPPTRTGSYLFDFTGSLAWRWVLGKILWRKTATQCWGKICERQSNCLSLIMFRGVGYFLHSDKRGWIPKFPDKKDTKVTDSKIHNRQYIQGLIYIHLISRWSDFFQP